jgi:hypothetical protein
VDVVSLDEWEIDTEFIRNWLESLSDQAVLRLDAAFIQLAIHGPRLGRPLVDRIQGSRIHNLKQLRPVSNSRQHLRVLFVFTEARSALMLAAGDKRGNWERWYDRTIAEAEENYDRYLNV